MHSGFPLGEHFVQGVRELPWYLQAILSGDEPDADLPEHIDRVAGVVIVSDE
jgi:hypothetical protein